MENIVSQSICDLDLSLVKLGKSGRTIKVLYNKKPLVLSTLKMRLPFGVKVYPSNYGGSNNCHLDCSMLNNTSTSSQKFLEASRLLDQRICELISENMNLFPDQNEDDLVVSDHYNPIFKKNGDYPELCKINLPRDSNGNFKCVIFDQDKNKVQIEDKNVSEVLTKNKSFKGIIECNKVWFFKGRFGTQWNLNQLKFIKPTPVSALSDDGGDSVYTTMMIID
jgi:hypothetical protein